jgi:hypothetical protein
MHDDGCGFRTVVFDGDWDSTIARYQVHFTARNDVDIGGYSGWSDD